MAWKLALFVSAATLSALALLSLSLPAHAQQPPQLVIISPAGLLDNRTVVPTSFQVSFAVTSFEIVQPGLPGQANRASQGHLRVFLDGKYYAIWATPNPVPFVDMPPGNHTIKLELVNNDHTSLRAEVSKTIKITVRATPPISDLRSNVDSVRRTVNTLNSLVIASLIISVISLGAVIAVGMKKRA